MKGVIDTMVVRKANALLKKESREGRKFLKRIELLKSVLNGDLIPCIAAKLLSEYRAQLGGMS